MKFSSVSQKKFINYNETDPGTVIATGKLIGKSENKFNPNINDWLIKPTEGPVIHLFGTGGLQYHLADMDMGTILQITYLGKQEIEKSNHKFAGKEAHSFDIAIADDSEDVAEMDAVAIKEVETTVKAAAKAAPVKATPAKTAAKAAPKAAASKTVDLSDLD